jgi:medium-chain acyl-[acyl-carrier-protein] hydrolase
MSLRPLAHPNRWVFRPLPRPLARQRLFVFPCAGGTPSSYREWCGSLPETTEVIPVRLPGRESRLLEKAISDMPPLVEAAFNGLLPYLDLPFAFVGHSMGTLLAFELTRSLRRAGQRGPTALIVMGHRAPDVALRRTPLCQLPDSEFWRSVSELGGTPREVLESKELLELLAPTLRADLKACELYAYTADDPIALPISAYFGREDAATTPADVEAWSRHTSAQFGCRAFHGGHFFPHTSISDVLKAVLIDARLPFPEQ